MSNTPINNPDSEKTWKNDLRDFIRTSRKAITAGLGALAGSLGAAVPVIFADGIVTQAELVPAVVVSVGAGLSVGLAVYGVSNDAA